MKKAFLTFLIIVAFVFSLELNVFADSTNTTFDFGAGDRPSPYPPYHQSER